MQALNLLEIMMKFEDLQKEYRVLKSAVQGSNRVIRQLEADIEAGKKAKTPETFIHLIEIIRVYRSHILNLVSQASAKIATLDKPIDILRCIPTIKLDIQKCAKSLQELSPIMKGLVVGVNYNHPECQESMNKRMDEEIKGIYADIEEITNNFYYMMPNPPLGEKPYSRYSPYRHNLFNTFQSQVAEMCKEIEDDKLLRRLEP